MYIGIRNLDPKLNPTDIFSDRDLTVALANPQTLDSFGRSTNKIWIPGRYSMKIEDSNNVQKYEELDLGELPLTGITSLTNVLGINSISADATPAIVAYIDQQVFLFVPANTNTGSTTLNINSVGAKTIEFSNAVLSGGELLAGTTYQVAFNETDDVFDLLGEAIATKSEAEIGTNNVKSMTPLRTLQNLAFNKSRSGNAIAYHKNLIIIDASTSTVDIDADEIELADTNNLPFLAKSVNLTANLSSSGVNGLDTGSETASTLYFLWVIYNGTTVASLLSISSTAPTLPSGYTHKGLVGAIFNNSGSDFDNFLQTGDVVERKLDTTSGTSILWGGIPSAIDEVSLGLVGVSSNGVSQIIVREGDSGGEETTGYINRVSFVGASTGTDSSSVGFLIWGAAAAAGHLYHGKIILSLEDSSNFTWVATVSIMREDGAFISVGSGSKSLSAELDRLSLTTEGGSDVFDAGFATLKYRYGGAL